MSATLDYNPVTTDNSHCGAVEISDTASGRANYAENSPKTSSSEIFRHGGIRENAGGPRQNSGGPRPNCGGPQPGSGRPRKQPIIPLKRGDALLWYCARTKWGAELDADMAFRTAGFETFLPMQWIPPVPSTRTQSGRVVPARSERIVPLFERALFVRLEMSKPWRTHGTDAVIDGFMADEAQKAIAIPDREITWLREGLSANGCWYPKEFDLLSMKKDKRRWASWFDGLAAVQAGLVVA
jgi:Transcription termination factor nusG